MCAVQAVMLVQSLKCFIFALSIAATFRVIEVLWFSALKIRTMIQED
jgi:hypothetical protein